MSIIKKFKKSKYSQENLVKLSDTNIASDVKKMERYGLVEQGDVIRAEDHNEIQHNGVIFSKPTYTLEGEINIYSLEDFVMEQEVFEGLKLKLLIDTDAKSNICEIKINDTKYQVNEKFTAGNVYNLVYANEQFIVEKSGGGISFTTIFDEDINITPEKEMTSSGISIPNIDYNLINIVLSYQDNYQNQEVIVKVGVMTSKDLIVRNSLVDVNTARSNAISCQPQEMYSDFQISIFIKDDILYFYSPYGFRTITHVKIDVL